MRSLLFLLLSFLFVYTVQHFLFQGAVSGRFKGVTLKKKCKLRERKLKQKKKKRVRFEKKNTKQKQSSRESRLEKVCQSSLRRAPRIVAVQTRGDGGHYSDRGVCQVC